MKGLCQLFRIIHDHILYARADTLCRIDGNTVARVDACPLDMFHDTGDQYIIAVTYGIDFYFFSHQVFID